MLAAVVARPDGGPDGSGQRAVQVWQRSNWRWYLKHEARHAVSQVRAHPPDATNRFSSSEYTFLVTASRSFLLISAGHVFT